MDSIDEVLMTEKQRDKLEKQALKADTKYGGIVGAMAYPEILCKAQCLKLLEWLEGYCDNDDHPEYYNDEVRWECPDCILELESKLKEVGK